MFHACVEKFDVTDTVGNFLGTKQGLSGEISNASVHETVRAQIRCRRWRSAVEDNSTS